MSALEQRLNNAEALLGAIICSNDTRATTLVADLSTDSLASSILSRVREGEYGLASRAARDVAPRRSIDVPSGSNNSPPSPSPTRDDRSLMSKIEDVFTTPSIEWQDRLNLRLALRSKVRVSANVSNAQKNSNTYTANRYQINSGPPNGTGNDEQDELISSADEDIQMNDTAVGSAKQFDYEMEMKGLPTTTSESSIICPYSSCGLKHQPNRPVCVVLLNALGLDEDTLTPRYRVE